MSMTVEYKQYQRGSRTMTVEDLFNKGMRYIGNPLQEGYVKALVNFDLKYNGEALSPRAGLQQSTVVALNEIVAQPIIHHVNSAFVSLPGDDAILCRYVLIGMPYENKYINLTSATIFVEYPNKGLIKATCSSEFKRVHVRSNVDWKEIHDVTLEAPQPFGMCASVDANTYVMCTDYHNMTTYLGILRLTVNSFGPDGTPVITFDVEKVAPKEIQPSQALSGGYNMLSPTPYEFSISTTATGQAVLNGILPYKDGTLTFNAAVGERITFRLFYQYPPEDLTNGKKYRVHWQINNLASDTEVTYLQTVRNSPIYTPGDAIDISCVPAYKQFTVSVKLYYSNEVDAVTYKSVDDDLNTIPVIQSIVLASTYLTADTGSSIKNSDVKTYDLTTAQGMCHWGQRVVLWGVRNALSTLFISDINNPAYFPYPNNAEVLNDTVIGCVPYMSDLLVFTASRLYRLTWAVDGSYYTTKVIQERIAMTTDDINTIQIVKNMVYFKSGNYFYMVVPNNSTSYKEASGELQLAPVSTTIENVLDNFQSAVETILDDTYYFSKLFDLKNADLEKWVLTLQDYSNYLDQACVRNVYKYKLTVDKLAEDGVTINQEAIYIDFVLNYDTITRAWTVYTYQANQCRTVPWELLVTYNSKLITVAKTATGYAAAIIECNKASCKDNFLLDVKTHLTGRCVPNYQLVDTGYRDVMSQLKKRFREVQFTINNTSQHELKFATEFLVADDTRKHFFEYNVTHVTDPDDPNYGLVYVELTPAELVANAVTLDSANVWKLDFSRFTELTTVKVRFHVSGKGYNGRLRILSINDDMYEITNMNWVYRMMYAR